jgi:hypothetical protein
MQDPNDEEKLASQQAAQSRDAGTRLGLEQAYLRYGPKLWKIATGKFRIPPADAHVLVFEVFTTYGMHAAEVSNLEGYLIGSICNASRHYLHPSGDTNLMSCGETPCAATPDDGL